MTCEINIHFPKMLLERVAHRCSLSFLSSHLRLHLHFTPSLYLNCICQVTGNFHGLKLHDYFSVLIIEGLFIACNMTDHANLL